MKNNVQVPAGAVERRRDAQRETLVTCAERAIAEGGLAALKARELAACAGCSLGAIYNLVRDIDELVLRVGQRTMAELDGHLAAVAGDGSAHRDCEAQLVAFARAYRAFAAANTHRWRALFEFRIAPGTALPPWFVADRARVFARLEHCLAPLLRDEAAVVAQARTLFSAVHGLVLLGLDDKLADGSGEGSGSPGEEAELVAFVRVYLAGLKCLPPPWTPARRKTAR